MKIQTESVFAFEFCFCVFESDYGVQSIHKTKAGAYRAMMEHKNNLWMSDRELGTPPEEILLFKRWRIKDYSLEE